MVNARFRNLPRTKLSVDFDDMWRDVVAAYKSPMSFQTQLRITLDGKPPIDTGGVRRQVYTKVFESFASNTMVKLFEGSDNHLRPACTAEARSSGLFQLLGTMVAHSLCQDGIGFPYLSPTCYSYITAGEEKALQLASIQDIPSDSAFLISQVLCLLCDIAWEF